MFNASWSFSSCRYHQHYGLLQADYRDLLVGAASALQQGLVVVQERLERQGLPALQELEVLQGRLERLERLERQGQREHEGQQVQVQQHERQEQAAREQPAVEEEPLRHLSHHASGMTKVGEKEDG